MDNFSASSKTLQHTGHSSHPDQPQKLKRLPSYERTSLTSLTSCRGEQTQSLVVVEAAGRGVRKSKYISPKAGGQIQTALQEDPKGKDWAAVQNREIKATKKME